MTGTLAQEQETYALDPSTAYVEVEPSTPSEPILSVAEIEAEAKARAKARFSAVPKCGCAYRGLTMASLCKLHLEALKLATRGAILSGGISTRADALAALDLVAELDGDDELVDHLLTSLRQFLTVD